MDGDESLRRGETLPARQGPGTSSPAFGFRVSDFGFRISGLGFRVSGYDLRVSSFGFRFLGFGFRVSGFGFRVSGFGFRVSGLEFGVSGFRFRVSGMGAPGAPSEGRSDPARRPGSAGCTVEGVGLRGSGLGER